MQNKIIIVAAEPSADMHGAALAKELKLQDQNLKIFGIGSEKMRESGVELFADLTQYAVVGFLEVLRHINVYKKVFQLTLKKIRELTPGTVILIDFPGFNLRLAKKIKKDFPQVKIIYYISPQIWAWGKKRINIIKKVVDKMIVIFEFEKQLYEKHAVGVEFIGHPLLDIVHCKRKKSEVRKELNLSDDDIIIALLPGSREVEVRRILPVMLKSAALLYKLKPALKFILLKAPNIKSNLLQKLLFNYKHLNIRVVTTDSYEYLGACSFAWVCSGTATLEAAILGLPMVIIYKTSFITWLISNFLIELPYIGLVNVVAGEKIVPEFIQYQARPENIVKFSEDFLNSPEKQKDLIVNLSKVSGKLGQSNANKKAAQIILQAIT